MASFDKVFQLICYTQVSVYHQRYVFQPAPFSHLKSIIQRVQIINFFIV